MAHVRDSDTALWLHNKLGSAEELWIPSSISGIIKTSTIDNIYRCFPVLTTIVKLKLLLGILHLPRRNLEEMKHMIEGIIEVALDDSDLWVKLVANIVKSYPMTFNLNLDLRSSPIAQNVIQQLAEKVKDADTFASLPLECQLVNKTSLQSLVGSLPPLSRHFALKRKPKSAALRADLMHKSNEAVTQMKKGGIGGGNKMVPVKHRDMTRRSSDIVPLKRMPSRTGMSRSDSIRATSTPNAPGGNRTFSRLPSRQQAGGTKLLDISEQPIGGSGIGIRDSKRRKKQLQQQENIVSSQSQEEEEEEEEKPPDYAAGLVPTSMSSQSLEEEEMISQETSSDLPEDNLSSRRNTTDSMEHASSDEEEEIETHIVQHPTTQLDSSKATSSENDMMSPHNTTSSSREEMVSPQYSGMPHTTLQSPRTEESLARQKELQRPNEMSSPKHVVIPAHHMQPITQATASRNLPEMRQPVIQAPTQQSPIRSVARPANTVLVQHRPQTSIPMYAPNTVIMSPPRQPARLIRESAVLVQQQQPQHVQQPHQLPPPTQHFYQPRLPQQQLPQQPLSNQQQPVYMRPQQPQQLTPPVPKRGLTLTREQMFEAQEMFRTANRLTRPEKAIILGFMAGSRENPYPEQGEIVRIVLSESVQSIANPNGGGILPVIVETVFEMNYRTGQSVKMQRFKAALAVPQVGIKT